MKISLHKILYGSILLLACFPLLKFDWSAKIVFFFCLVSIIDGIKKKSFYFTLKRCRFFFILSSLFITFCISLLYSQNYGEGLKLLIQFIPLLIIPFLISFYKNDKLLSIKWNKVFNLFIVVNFLYTILTVVIFFLSKERFETSLSNFLFDYDKFQFIIQKKIEGTYFLFHKPYFSMGFVLISIYSLNKLIRDKVYKLQLNKFYAFNLIYFSFWVFYAFSFPNIIAYLLLIIYIVNLNFSKKKFYTFLALSMLLIMPFIFLKSNDKDVQRGYNFVKTLFTNEQFEIQDDRIEVYKSTFNLIKNSSLTAQIFGHGIGDAQSKLNSQYLADLKLRKEKNLLSFSEEFNHKFWFRNNIRVEENGYLSPFGDKTADLLYSHNDNVEVSHNISTDIIKGIKGTYTFSVFLKNININQIILRLGNIDQIAFFDLKNGVVTSRKNVELASIERLNNHWFRCSIRTNLKGNGLLLMGFSNNNLEYNLKTIDVKKLLVWGMQLEENQLTKYVKSKNSQLQMVADQKLNTHNNYLQVFLISGFFGLFGLIIALVYFFKYFYKTKNVIGVSFVVIIVFNCLTENILFRHWGLMLITFVSILVCYNSKKNFLH